MTAVESRAEVFWMAFSSLSRAERHKVVNRLLKDPEFMEDLVDIAIARQRSQEPARPFEEYLAEQRKRKKAS